MSRSYVLALVTSLCCASGIAYAAPAEPAKINGINFASFTGKITGTRVRLRLEPSLDGQILKELNRDDLFVIEGEEGNFYAVRPPKGMKGYIFRSYILDNVVEASRVNIRLEPDLESPIVGLLHAGDRVEGTISTQNNKWLETDLPTSTRFYVAKEYVQSIGPANLLDTLQRRRMEASQLLTAAYAFSQTELRKPFDQVDIASIDAKFKKIIDSYQDIPEQANKAKEMLKIIDDTYAQNKMAFLDYKAQQAAATVEEKQRLLNQQLKSYQEKLSTLEAQLEKEQGRAKAYSEYISNNLAVTDDHSPSAPSAPPVNASISDLPQEAPAPLVTNRPQTDLSQTEKTRMWAAQEDQVYSQWLRQHPKQSLNDFYRLERDHAVTLTGTLETYQRHIKNRPGDYILKAKGQPIAYLYSTQVDLENKLGQQVTIIGLKRPNKNFAYPAYFVVEVK